jgi:type IV secretory pathway VirB4 component
MIDIINEVELEKLLPDQKEENDDVFLFLGKNQSGKTTLINFYVMKIMKWEVMDILALKKLRKVLVKIKVLFELTHQELMI